MIADFWAFAAEHVISFSAGVLVGLGMCSRFRIVRRKEGE